MIRSCCFIALALVLFSKIIFATPCAPNDLDCNLNQSKMRILSEQTNNNSSTKNSNFLHSNNINVLDENTKKFQIPPPGALQVVYNPGLKEFSKNYNLQNKDLDEQNQKTAAIKTKEEEETKINTQEQNQDTEPSYALPHTSKSTNLIYR
jgi:hypothetical protein